MTEHSNIYSDVLRGSEAFHKNAAVIYRQEAKRFLDLADEEDKAAKAAHEELNQSN